MFIKKLSLVLLLLSIGILIIRCQKTDTCLNAICTQEFRSVTIHVRDSTGKPAIFDRLDIVVNKQVIKSITSPVLNSSDVYLVADDSFLNLIGTNQTIDATAEIYKNAVLVKSFHYQFKTDCCHINHLIGDTLVIIN